MNVFQFLAILLGIISSNGLAPANRPFVGQAPVDQTTFVQLTDAHLFDEGWNRPFGEALRLTANNWDALHWSIDEINRMVSAGKHIDFVVYTGDLGLQNVDFSHSEACLVPSVRPEAGLPPIPEQSAVENLSAELEWLSVRTIYFVSGNNDPIDEDARDGRFDCFLASLGARAKQGPHPFIVEKLESRQPRQVHGLTLLGINSASFKKAKNYQDACAEPVKYPVRDTCPREEINALDEQLSKGTPVLLFTHIPDLKDPFRLGPAWDIPPDVRSEWELEVNRANVLGVFAGHLHDSDRSLYGTTVGTQRLAISKAVCDKTYVAPPLAIKNQANKPEAARGFLVATVSPSGISDVQIVWFADNTLLTLNRFRHAVNIAFAHSTPE